MFLNTYICIGIFNLGSLQLSFELSEKQVRITRGPGRNEKEVYVTNIKSFAYSHSDNVGHEYISSIEVRYPVVLVLLSLPGLSLLSITLNIRVTELKRR